MRQLESDWRSLVDDPAHASTKDDYIQLRADFEKLFRSRLTDADVHQLWADCDASVGELRIDFCADVSAFLVKILIQHADRKNLVNLLSMQCPAWLDWPESIEFYLACRGDKLKDPILVLGEAYSMSEGRDANRRAIAAAVRRAFVDLGLDGKVDDDFVNNAMQWYQLHEEQLEPNWEYVTNETKPNGHQPLFKKKSPAQ